MCFPLMLYTQTSLLFVRTTLYAANCSNLFINYHFFLGVHDQIPIYKSPLLQYLTLQLLGSGKCHSMHIRSSITPALLCNLAQQAIHYDIASTYIGPNNGSSAFLCQWSRHGGWSYSPLRKFSYTLAQTLLLISQVLHIRCSFNCHLNARVFGVSLPCCACSSKAAQEINPVRKVPYVSHDIMFMILNMLWFAF